MTSDSLQPRASSVHMTLPRIIRRELVRPALPPVEPARYPSDQFFFQLPLPSCIQLGVFGEDLAAEFHENVNCFVVCFSGGFRKQKPATVGEIFGGMAEGHQSAS